MKSYIVDANVIFSGVVSGKEMYVRAFAANSFYTPDFALDEIRKYQELILKKTKLPPEKLRSFTLQLFSKLIVVPNFLISNKSYLEAFRLCKDIDENDTTYLALSIEFEMTMISKDEKLVEGLRAKGYQEIISLREFLSQAEQA